MRTIRVTGKGRVSLTPDRMLVNISLEGACPEYAAVLKECAERRETLQGLLAPLGFAPSDMKTLSLNVHEEYEGYQEDGVYRQRFTGYRYAQQLKLEFPFDNERLGKVLAALAGSGVGPQFHISFTMSDPEAARNELLARAVEDASEKARVLAKAAGTALGGIQSIDYSWGSVVFESTPVNMPMMAKRAMMEESADSFDLDIQPDDIRMEDTITVVWEI